MAKGYNIQFGEQEKQFSLIQTLPAALRQPCTTPRSTKHSS